ncbi:hypothetical protein BJ138DRAFT_1111566 [Hygrophoropsis aurantiaca]|uniref:Uncharacterized protein n=1 Tax=Hygrophoropsis aurantiaca TaxID=72124 RepID=A0ACB8AKL8_9AGAM|nr:hypothetical protein BJ138DRAFT_1111566 [Hygrophoropsis aurantiaca]
MVLLATREIENGTSTARHPNPYEEAERERERERERNSTHKLIGGRKLYVGSRTRAIAAFCLDITNIHMSRTARGYNPTVRLAAPAEEAIALTAPAEEGYEDRIYPKYPMTVLEIYDQAENEKKYFYVGKPEVEPSSLVGRATRAYIAVDAKRF